MRFDMMRLIAYKVNFEVTHEGHQNCLKTYLMNILMVMSDQHM